MNGDDDRNLAGRWRNDFGIAVNGDEIVTDPWDNSRRLLIADCVLSPECGWMGGCTCVCTVPE